MEIATSTMIEVPGVTSSIPCHSKEPTNGEGHTSLKNCNTFTNIVKTLAITPRGILYSDCWERGDDDERNNQKGGFFGGDGIITCSRNNDINSDLMVY